MESVISKIDWKLSYQKKYLEERLQYNDLSGLIGDFFVDSIVKKNRPKIYFIPERPNVNSVAFKLCAILGYKIMYGKLQDVPDIYFRTQDKTFATEDSIKEIDKKRCINFFCTDISKKNVEKKFSEIFGYSLGVVPFDYSGEIVEKANLNARHDGRIIEAPIEYSDFDDEMVYEKLIDNELEGDSVLDYRVPIYGEKIPLIYLKYRPVKSRFLNDNTMVEMESPENVFESSEIHQIIQFAKSIGMDYGELDVLRNRRDGRIYIVDANNTPFGPPNGLSEKNMESALSLMAVSFKELIQQFKLK